MDQRALIQSIPSSRSSRSRRRRRSRDKRTESHQSWTPSPLQQQPNLSAARMSLFLRHDVATREPSDIVSGAQLQQQLKSKQEKKRARKKLKVKMENIPAGALDATQKKKSKTKHKRKKLRPTLVLNQSMTDLEVEGSDNIASFGEMLTLAHAPHADLVDLSGVISDMNAPKKKAIFLPKKGRRNGRPKTSGNGTEVMTAAAKSAKKVAVRKLSTIKEGHVRLKKKQRDGSNAAALSDFIPRCRLKDDASQPLFELVPLTSSVSATADCDAFSSSVECRVDDADADQLSTDKHSPRDGCSKSKKKKKTQKNLPKKTAAQCVDGVEGKTRNSPLQRFPSNVSSELMEPTPRRSPVEKEIQHEAWIKERQQHIAEIVRDMLKIKDGDDAFAPALQVRSTEEDDAPKQRAKTPQLDDGLRKAFVFHGVDCIGDVIELDTDKIFWNIHRSHKLFNCISPSELCKRFAV